MKKKNPKLYVVGYPDGGNTALYSKRAWCFPPESVGGIERMTMPQAIKHIKKEFPKHGHTIAIFKMVVVKKIKHG